MMMNLQLFDGESTTRLYQVNETTFVCVNGVGTWLYKNTVLHYNKQGTIDGVICDGTEIDLSELDVAQAIQSLIDAGVVEDITPEETEGEGSENA